MKKRKKLKIKINELLDVKILKKLEMKIYELLGVKIFKKLALTIQDKIWLPFTFKMSEKEKKKYLNDRKQEYNLGKVKNIEDVQKFQKRLRENIKLHAICFAVLIPSFLLNIGFSNILMTILTGIIGLIDLECVMLQRYNLIKMDNLIEEMKEHDNVIRRILQKQLRRGDFLLGQQMFKTKDKNGQEISANLEYIVRTGTTEELKKMLKLLKKYDDLMKKTGKTKKAKVATQDWKVKEEEQESDQNLKRNRSTR